MNISLIFTCLRLILSPCLLAPLIALQAPVYLTFLCYCFLAATDFFDGFFARRYHQVSQLGAFLDQFADKIFLFSVAIATVWTGQCLWWWALLLVFRELLVMGFREYGAQKNISLPVIYSAKIKTALQMIFFGWVVLGISSAEGAWVASRFFALTIFFSYYSAYYYGKNLLHAFH